MSQSLFITSTARIADDVTIMKITNLSDAVKCNSSTVTFSGMTVTSELFTSQHVLLEM
jgi:hypothetical protein